MNIKTFAIEQFVKFFTTSGSFKRIIDAVKRQDLKDTPNNEKFDAVKAELKIIGLELVGFVENLLIELAVNYVRSKAGAV